MSEQDAIFPDQLPASLFAQVASSPLRVSIDKIVPLKQAREIVETELIVKALKEYHSLRRIGEILGLPILHYYVKRGHWGFLTRTKEAKQF